MHRLLRDETVTPVATNCNNQLHICINGARASDNGPEPLFCNANARVRNSLARERREFVRCRALLRPVRPVALEGGVSPPLSQHLDQRPGQCRTLPGLQPGLGQQQLQVLVLQGGVGGGSVPDSAWPPAGPWPIAAPGADPAGDGVGEGIGIPGL